MSHKGFSHAEWFEVGAGIMLLSYAFAYDTLAFGGELGRFLPEIFVFGFASIFLSHAVIRKRPLRVSLVGVTITALILASSVAVLGRDIVSAILFATWAVGVFVGEKHVSGDLKERDKERDKDARSRNPNLISVVTGSVLIAVGTAFVGSAIWPEWFRFHIDRLLFGGGAYLITAFIFIFAGAGLVFAEIRNLRLRYLFGARALSALCVAGLGLSYLTGPAPLIALPFFAVAVLVGSLSVLPRLYVEPVDVEVRTLERKLVYRYARAGQIMVWIFVPAFSPVIFTKASEVLLYVIYAAAVLLSVLFHYRRTIEEFTQRNYLIELFLLALVFDVLWFAEGGLNSPLTGAAYVFIIASGIVLSSFWAIPIAFILWLTPFLDMFFNLHGRDESLLGFLFFTATFFIISFYAYFIGSQQSKFGEMLKKSYEVMKEALENKQKLQKKFLAKAAALESTNKELVEMRSALLNVLEDVEKSNRQLQIDQHRQEAIFSSLGEGLVAVDVKGKIILVNRMAISILSARKEDLIGRPIEAAMRFYEGDSEILQTKIFEEAWSGRRSNLSGTAVLLDFKGERIPIAGSVSPVLDDAERISGIVLAFRDVTIEREIDQQKSSFITVASHQLRTPINAVRWYVDLLLGGDAGRLSKQQKEFLTDVSTSVVRMASLIDDLLQVSRAETGEMNVKFQKIFPEALAKDIVRETRLAAKKKKQTFEVDISKGLPSLRTDKTIVGEVLSNFLSNAVAYTPEGGKLGLRISPDARGLRFEVWDTGYGLSKEDQHHIFEKFYRGERATSMETVGTGLGLYISKRIIEAVGGTIGFESKVGKGSRFFFILPTDSGSRAP